jgi:hypothetical protein
VRGTPSWSERRFPTELQGVPSLLAHLSSASVVSGNFEACHCVLIRAGTHAVCSDAVAMPHGMFFVCAAWALHHSGATSAAPKQWVGAWTGSAI